MHAYRLNANGPAMWPFNTTREAYEPVVDREQADGEDGVEDVVVEKAGWVFAFAGLMSMRRAC